MNNLTLSLSYLGVENIYFCAGARNSSLVETLSSFQQIFSLDERSASFSALGHAKLHKIPVAICITSGTAVAECLPAVIEAYYSHTPLIVISADRPSRLQGTYAPQTINQVGIYGDYARYEFNGIEKDLAIIDPQYPMHLNVQVDSLENDYHPDIKYLSAFEFEKILQKDLATIILFTEGSQECEREFCFFNDLGFPIHMECTSELNHMKILNPIIYEQTLVELFYQKKIDVIIKFGGTPISKLWRLLDSADHSIEIISYHNEKVGLPYGYVYTDNLPVYSKMKKPSQQKYREKDLTHFLQIFPLSEAAVFEKIVQSIDIHDLIYVGNSMPIRYMQMINYHIGKRRVFAARGANGIDGQVSMAIGMANGTAKNIHCLVGDLTFMYDLGVTAMHLPSNLFIHVINNKGGRIFEQINVHQKMILEHSFEIEKMISGFSGREQIFEYLPDLQQTRSFWKAWTEPS